jgi:hypothetical protein
MHKRFGFRYLIKVPLRQQSCNAQGGHPFGYGSHFHNNGLSRNWAWETGGAAARKLMNLKTVRCGVQLATIIWTLGLASGAGAQENLDRGKSPVQLFASDCSICHKSPQGLAKAGELLGLDNFLRTHYTASRESASAIASYLRSVDSGPPARAIKRSPKGDGKAQTDDKKKTGTKPGEAKGTEKKSDAAATKPSKAYSSKPTETTPAGPRPADILAPEPKVSASKP